jgi:hypothetical protein
MTSVFVAGSRNLSALNEEVRERLNNLISGSYKVLVGDANGADKAVQKFFHDRNYNHVIVYCSGEACRNNIGDWPVIKVSVPPSVKGRDFHVRKDLEMAHDADYGLMIWDAKSPGTLGNVLELLKEGKNALVYVSRDSSFHPVTSGNDLEDLLAKCSPEEMNYLRRKINLEARISEIESIKQQALHL